MPEQSFGQFTTVNENTGDRLIAAIAARSRATTTEQHKPLPVGTLASLPGDGSLTYQIASIDGRGRISDRSSIRTLGWRPGDRLSIEIVSGNIVLVRPQRHGLCKLNQQEYVRLPAAVRHWCGMQAGKRVFLSAAAGHDVLVVHSMLTLDSMVLSYYTSLPREDQS